MLLLMILRLVVVAMFGVMPGSAVVPGGVAARRSGVGCVSAVVK